MPEDGLYCPNCGEKLNQAHSPPPLIGVTVSKPFPEDQIALSCIQKYAFISVINIVAWLGVYFYFLTQSLLLLFPKGAIAPAQFLQIVFFVADGLCVGGAIIAVVSLYFLRTGFQSLRNVSDEFATPSTLTLVALVSIPILYLILIFFVGYFLSFIPTFQNPAIAPPSFPLGSFVLVSALMFIVSVAAFVGEVGGVLLGIWRLGARYDESLFKAAVICTFIPFLSFIVPILELVGVHQIRKNWVSS